MVFQWAWEPTKDAASFQNIIGGRALFLFTHQSHLLISTGSTLCCIYSMCRESHICSVDVLLALFWRRNNAQVSIVADMFMNSIEEITSRSKQAWGIAGHDMAGRFILCRIG